jgi:uncharacterized tellurite resistance protein B-like protein
MAINWQDVRYRGDVRDVDEMFETYRVGDYLETFEENARQRDEGIRGQLLRDGIRLTAKLSPRIFSLFYQVCERLELKATADVFCLSSPDINAFAARDMRGSEATYLVGVTARALEQLDDLELRSILGHEVGHFLYGNNRLNALISLDQGNPSATVLPALGESLFLRWRKKAEISADRAGLLASGDFSASARSLLKATFGLSEKNLNLDVGSLLAQIEEIKGKPELVEEAFASHPLLPIRLKALELFSASEKASRNGFVVNGHMLTDDELEESIDDLIRLTRRYPHEPLQEDLMRLVALGGALLLSADGDVSDDEVKILVRILHQYFTDEPEREIVTDRDEIKRGLAEVAKRVREKGDDGDARFVLSRLAEVALADGALLDSEGTVILEIAEMLGVPSKVAYGVLVGAAQSFGFRADVKLNRIAEKLRRSLQTGFQHDLVPPPKLAG